MNPDKLINANLALDKPVTVSGGSQGSHVPQNAVDGIVGNESGWHADPYPQWLKVDLQKPTIIDAIKLHTYHDSRRYYQYTIETSIDGKTWKPIVNMTKNVEPSKRQGDEHNFAPVKARFVKVNMLNNSANPGVHINELMVFEAKRK
ncbi:MAG: discoidin domain-containing protein [Planctomycetota bacterium]